MSKTRSSVKYRRMEVVKNVAAFFFAIVSATVFVAVGFGLLFGFGTFFGGAFLGFVVGLIGAVRVALNKGKAPDDVAHGGYMGPMGAGGDGGA